MNWASVTDWLTQYGWKILLVIFVAVVIYLLMRRLVPPTLRRAVTVQMRGQPEEEIKKRADTLSRVLITVGIVVIGIIALFTILDQVGVNITAALAGMGVVGVAIGFGAQSLVKDFLAGLFILLENQYRVGDVVRIAGVAGIVEEITLRRTILRDLDGIVHSVPNGEIKVASNLTKEWSRANMMINVAYKEDLDEVIEILKNIWKEMKNDPQWGEFILKEEPMLVRVDEFGASGIGIRFTGETKPIKQWDVMGELRRRIKKVFDEKGIEIPWPHTKVYFGGPLEQQIVERLSKEKDK
ncbi:MAG TPA: mechanosensitive ion channel domain-containing protein [Dehalococcoidia bacterium]|nr:mechanosensitive ion channel domain-containing protein [Dehalococcoidia bacterium]